MNHFAALVMSAPPLLDDGLNALGQGAGAGVALSGPAPDSGARHPDAQTGVAALAQPPEIPGVIVRLFAVAAIDHRETPAAQGCGAWLRIW